MNAYELDHTRIKIAKHRKYKNRIEAKFNG